MQKRTREIIGLALLVVLGIGVACVMGWYILVGHSWNVTASNIDDSIGQMDGYTIILFEGTNSREDQIGADKDASVQGESANGPQNAKSPAAQSGASGANGAELPDSGGSGSSDDAAAKSRGQSPTIEEVQQSYQEKGAAVVRINPASLAFYEDPFVVAKEGKRIGLCAVSEPARVARARVDVKLLSRQASSFNVLITDDANLSSAPLRGVNVIVCSAQQGAAGKCWWVGSTYCVNCPRVGEVQAIIVSPSGVISSKTIDAL